MGGTEVTTMDLPEYVDDAISQYGHAVEEVHESECRSRVETERDAKAARNALTEAIRKYAASLSSPSGGGDVGHRVAPPTPAYVVCVCDVSRNCGETWWLVERRDVQPPQWLAYTGKNPPEWTDNAWRAQRWSERNRLDAHKEAEIVALTTGFKVEAISHGFVGGERVIAETRCDSCGSEWVKRLPIIAHAHVAPVSTPAVKSKEDVEREWAERLRREIEIRKPPVSTPAVEAKGGEGKCVCGARLVDHVCPSKKIDEAWDMALPPIERHGAPPTPAPLDAPGANGLLEPKSGDMVGIAFGYIDWFVLRDDLSAPNSVHLWHSRDECGLIIEPREVTSIRTATDREALNARASYLRTMERLAPRAVAPTKEEKA